jgi:hypothetical protein
MIPSAADVVRMRWIMTACVRLVSIAVGLLALVPVLSWVQEGVWDGDLLNLYYYSTRLILSLVLGMIGLLGLVLAAPLVRAVTPMPTRVLCPKCGYRLTGRREGQCPECGLDVSSMLLGGERGHILEAPAMRARAVLRVTVVFRVSGVLIVIFSAALLLWELSAWYDLMYRTDPEMLLSPICLVMGGVFIFALSGWLAERVVPRGTPWTESKPPPLPSQSAVGGDHGSDDGGPHETRTTG